MLACTVCLVSYMGVHPGPKSPKQSESVGERIFIYSPSRTDAAWSQTSFRTKEPSWIQTITKGRIKFVFCFYLIFIFYFFHCFKKSLYVNFQNGIWFGRKRRKKHNFEKGYLKNKAFSLMHFDLHLFKRSGILFGFVSCLSCIFFVSMNIIFSSASACVHPSKRLTIIICKWRCK